jgi:O-antigen ligase
MLPSEKDNLPWEHWILLLAIVVSPVALHVTEVLFCGYVVMVASRKDLWHRLPRKQIVIMAMVLLLLGLWLIYRTLDPLGLGLHTLVLPARFPVTLLDYLPFLAVFFILSLCRHTNREIRSILWALVATVPVHFLLAVGQRYLGWFGIWSMTFADFPFVQIVLSKPYSGRVDGGLYNFNGLGAYAVLAAIAAAILLVGEREPAKTRDGVSAGAVLRLAALSLCFLLCLVLMAWSGSRNSWAVFVAVGFLFATLVGMKLRYLVGPVLLCCVLVLLAGGNFGWMTRASRFVVPTIVWGRILGHEELRISRVSWRVEVFECGLDLTVERPLLGWGIGHMAPECEERLGHRVNHAHNIFLQMSSELGIPFALIASALLGFVFLTSARAVLHLANHEERLLYGGLYLIAVAVMLLSQIALAVMHSTRLEIIFWLSLSVPFSLVVREWETRSADPDRQMARLHDATGMSGGSP